MDFMKYPRYGISLKKERVHILIKDSKHYLRDIILARMQQKNTQKKITLHEYYKLK